MEPLGKLLGKIRKALAGSALEKELIVESVKDVTGFEVRVADISIKGKNIFIKTTPPKRSEINLHEKEILQKIQSKTGLKLEKILY